MSDTKTPAPVHPLLEGTPDGPWKLDAGQERCPATDEYEVWVTVVTQSGQMICDVTLEEDSSAIAALIAMAPTLAAENARLRAALEEIIYQAEEGMPISDIHQCIVDAREVLASLTT